MLVAPTGESSELVAADDEFAKMMGFLTERETLKESGGAALLPETRGDAPRGGGGAGVARAGVSRAGVARAGG